MPAMEPPADPLSQYHPVRGGAWNSTTVEKNWLSSRTTSSQYTKQKNGHVEPKIIAGRSVVSVTTRQKGRETETETVMETAKAKECHWKTIHISGSCSGF